MGRENASARLSASRLGPSLVVAVPFVLCLCSLVVADDKGLSRKSDFGLTYDRSRHIRAAEGLYPFFQTPAKKTIPRSELVDQGIPREGLSPSELTFELKRRHRGRNFILVFSPGTEKSDLKLDRVIVLRAGKRPSQIRTVTTSHSVRKDLSASSLFLPQGKAENNKTDPTGSELWKGPALSTPSRDQNEPMVGGGGLPDGTGKLPSLTSQGAELPPQQIDSEAALIRQTIDLGTDKPLATHVIARNPTNTILQRTETGRWVEWNGSEAALIDNRFEATANRITFEIDSGDLRDEFFPITYSLSYRTEAGLKFGLLEVTPLPATKN